MKLSRKRDATMTFHKCPKSVFAFVTFSFVIVASLSFGAMPQQHDNKQELRAKLFKQVIDDFKDLRECMEGEEGGLTAGQDKMTVTEIDLNRDGVNEYQVEMGGPCACGTVNCSIYVYRKAGQGFESLLDEAAGYTIETLKTSTNGYRDLRVTAHDSAATTSVVTYKFNGKQYRDATNTIVYLETGESKPAFRRLQFPRGASQTTVQGKVSIVLPDTYLVRARAGQTMTIKLTAARKAVRFRVMSPTTTSLVADDVRDWTGVLPESGDYHIMIDADERTSSYSMTVSIK